MPSPNELDIDRLLKATDPDDIQEIYREEPAVQDPLLWDDQLEDNPLAVVKPTMMPLPPLLPLSESAIPEDKGEKKEKKIDIREPPAGTKRKKETPKSRPAFVMKIWSMVNDKANHEYIRWNEDGQTFQVFHREEFMRRILPKYFKHNNFASFVRQLNMYGWHKVQDINSGTMQINVNSGDEIMQFENPNFKRDREDLLDNIVRNKSVHDQPSVPTQISSPDRLQVVLSELETLRRNQAAITEDLRRIRKDNKMLWQDNYVTRERHQQQQQTLEKILKFLAAVYGNSAGKILDADVPQQQPMSPGTFFAPKRRLMLTNGKNFFNQNDVNSDKDYFNQNEGNSGNLENSPSESIEEIIRSIGGTPNGEKGRNMYQQYVQEPVASPRHFFPELNSPYFDKGSDLAALEQNVQKQGQSIAQVQDWISRLAQQQNQNEHELDGFDMSEFLDKSEDEGDAKRQKT